jgi:regulator of telomere elongation helicase 1
VEKVRRARGQMPTYTLRGIEVDFPYDAYPCQQRYMESVLQSLLMGKHALLESPTGTGKTLCLLCAALAWQRHEVKLQQAVPPGAAPLPAEKALAAPRRRVIYASRTHSQLHHAIQEVREAPGATRCCVVSERCVLGHTRARART